MDPILQAAGNLGATQQPEGDPYLVERRQAPPNGDPPGKVSGNPPHLGDGGTSLPEVLEAPKKDQPKSFIVDVRDGSGVREHGHYPVNGPKNIFIFNFRNIHNRERKGSEKDVSNLTSVFKQIDYNVEPYENQDQTKFLSTLKEISLRKALARSKLFVLVVMSHGNRTDGQQFLTSDGKVVSIDTVRTMFNDRHCPQLKGIPKIFLAVFCRRLREDNSPSVETVDCNSAALSYSASTESKKARASDSGSPKSDFATEIPVKDLEEVGLLLSLLEEPLTSTEIEQMIKVLSSKTVLAVSALTGAEEDQTSSHLDQDSESNDSQKALCLDELPPILVRPKDFNDMMTLYACKKGYRSLRLFEVGSRFIIAFCEAVAKHGWHYNLDRLYADIEIRMAENCPDDTETLEGCEPDKESTKFKTCYLF